MNVTLLVLLIFVVILVVVILRQRNKRARWVLLALVFLFLVHPFLLGVPGFLGEMAFQRGLHAGMSPKQVIQLRDSTAGNDHGPSLGRIDLNPQLTPAFYMDWGTACATGGRVYWVHYDAVGHVDSWIAKRWYGGC